MKQQENMSKPPFDPNKPFQSAKPEFDPNQAFEEASPKIAQDSNLLSDIKDTGMGGIQGLMMGGADEAGGALQAIYSKLSQADTPESKLPFIDLYRKKQQELQKSFDESQERSPWLYGAGQIAGGVTSAMTLGGALGVGAAAGEAAGAIDAAAPALSSGARLLNVGKRGLETYKQALPIIAGESALSSKGDLTSIEGAKQLGKDVLTGAAIGLPATIGLQAAGEAVSPIMKKLSKVRSDVIENSPAIRQIGINREFGLDGINPSSELAQKVKPGNEMAGMLAHGEDSNVNELMDTILAPRKAIGTDIENSLAEATKLKTPVNFKDNSDTIINSFSEVADILPKVKSDEKLNYLTEKLANTSSLNPNETHDLLDYTDSFINKFKASAQTDPRYGDLLETLNDTRKTLSNTLKQAVPDYAKHAERYANYMEIPEQLIAGDVPIENKNIYYSRVNNPEDKAFLKMRQLVQGSTKPGAASLPVKNASNNLISKMQNFESDEMQRVARGEIPATSYQTSTKDFAKKLQNYSDQAVTIGSATALEPHVGTGSMIKQSLTGIGQTGRSVSMGIANLEGRIESKVRSGLSNLNKNPLAQLSRGIFNAPQETVATLAGKLKGVPGLEKYGNQLEHALASPDQNRRNQVLFTIMQNPSARQLVDSEPQE
jgi:hypothetical protein